jgi:hypothetical protein
MTRHLLWLVLGATALACSGPGSSDDDDDDGGSSGESGEGGSSGSKGGSSSNGGSTSGSSGSSGTTGSPSNYYCVNIDTACICVESSSSSEDTCTAPKPTCCFAATETNSCSCYLPDDPVCSLRGTTGYPAVTTCP